MNETVQEAVLDIIIGVLATAEQTKAFILSELPDVVQQLLLWQAVYSFLWFAIWMGVTCICVDIHYRIKAWLYSAPTPSADDIERRRILDEKGYSNRSAYEDMELRELHDIVRPKHKVYGPVHYWPLLGALTSFAVACATCLDWAQIIIAPKVYLLGYVSKLVT